MNLKPDRAAEQIPGQPGTHSKGYLSDTPPLACESLTHTSNELEGAARCWVGGWVEVARVKARAQLQVKRPVRVAPLLITSAGQDS